MPAFNVDNLTKDLLSPQENSELAASLFLYQLALKDKESGGELFGPNLCIQYSSGTSNDDPSQNFKLVTKNGIYATGSSKVDLNTKDFKRLKSITQLMNKYFNAIDAGPKLVTTGFTDGQRFIGSSDTSKANSRLGKDRAQNLARALGFSSFEHNSFISEHGQTLPSEKRDCPSRRATTLSFDATPKIQFGNKGTYTPSFEMIKDHKAIKKHAMFSALEKLGENDNDIEKTLESLPEGCNNPSTRKVLEGVKNVVFVKKTDYKIFSKRLDLVFPGNWESIKDNEGLKDLKYYLSNSKRREELGSIKKLLNKWPAEKAAQLSTVLVKLKEFEKKEGYESTVRIRRALVKSTISQSNHAYDCFDVKSYYEKSSNKPKPQDVSNFIKNGKLTISFTKDDFEGHGNHLHCNQCKSGMSLDSNGKVLRNVRTGEAFTKRAINQSFNPSEHRDALKTIKLASFNNFDSMASHKSMKVVVIRNCEDESTVDPFASGHEVLTINSVPFKKEISVPEGQKVCVVNMPVINTCTIEPQGEIDLTQKKPKRTAHYYDLDGRELSTPLLGTSLKALDYINEIVNSESFQCHSSGKALTKSASKLDAQSIINSISCENKEILVPNESNYANELECPDYFNGNEVTNN